MLQVNSFFVMPKYKHSSEVYNSIEEQVVIMSKDSSMYEFCMGWAKPDIKIMKTNCFLLATLISRGHSRVRFLY